MNNTGFDDATTPFVSNLDPSTLSDADLLSRLFDPITARDLLEKFNDIGRVVHANTSQLRAAGFSCETIARLKLYQLVTHRVARAKILNRPIISSWEAVLDYCHTTMSHLEIEHFRVLYLNRKNVLIADEEQARGTVDHVPVYPREIIKRALELNASALVLVHNHPSGDPIASDADIAMTDRIRNAAEVLGLTLHDHLIIGKSRELSFRGEGYL